MFTDILILDYMFIVVKRQENGWLATYLEIVISLHSGGTTRYNHNLFENTIIIVPPPNIYYIFIVVMRQKID